MSSPPVAEEPLLVPVGLALGVLFTRLGSTEHVQQIRIGSDVDRLNDQEFLVWAAAHGVPDKLAEGWWTRSATEETARQVGVADPGPIIDRFLADGTLAEVTPGTLGAIEFAGRYRLVPSMLGLGNTAEEPGAFRVGFGEPILALSSPLYSLWEWAHMEADLWSACQSLADMERDAGSTDPDETDPEIILYGLLASLHTLLSASAAYLDLRIKA